MGFLPDTVLQRRILAWDGECAERWKKDVSPSNQMLRWEIF